MLLIGIEEGCASFWFSWESSLPIEVPQPHWPECPLLFTFHCSEKTIGSPVSQAPAVFTLFELPSPQSLSLQSYIDCPLPLTCPSCPGAIALGFHDIQEPNSICACGNERQIRRRYFNFLFISLWPSPIRRGSASRRTICSGCLHASASSTVHCLGPDKHLWEDGHVCKFHSLVFFSLLWVLLKSP